MERNTDTQHAIIVQPQLATLARSFPRGWSLPGLALCVLLAAGGYLLASSRATGLGFPLDDAWIHQTYARNLAAMGQWAFIPGQPSAGSTAPLWSVLLAVGYWLHLAPYFWTYLCGLLSLLGLALVGEAWFRTAMPGLRSVVPWAGLLLAGEWHLVWAAVSGMETVLFALCILLVLWLVLRAASNGEAAFSAPARVWGLIGLLVGLSAWVRPDGATLLGPAAFTLVLLPVPWRKRAAGLFWLLAGTALLFGPYLLFNVWVQGSAWPNTFYAKQAEYAQLRQLPIYVRFFNEVKLPLIGAGLFLLPGFIAFGWQAGRNKQWARVALVLWFLGYALLYALRLPVTYQYGRYFIPAMPVYFVAGLVGSFELVTRLRANRLAWLLARVAILSGLLVWLGFYALGAGRYAQDVSFIETEMITTARWVAANTPPDALVAAHDIGALGYFGQRRLLDLAGLISPEVIPFIRNETAIARWLNQQQADYLVVLSAWYSQLPAGKDLLFQSDEDFAARSGGDPMQVYRWRP